MKKIFVIAFALCSLAVLVFGAGDSERKAIARILYGKIRIVSVGEDFSVRKVDLGEDLRVRVVELGADRPGRWRFVDVGEDYKVRFVDLGEDIRVRFVDFGEGPR